MAPLPEASQKAIREALDGVTNPGAKTGVPGLVFVAVDRKGEEVAKYASGVDGVGSKKPVSQDSIFWIASCTKMITGIACLQLHEQGKLDLDSHEQLYKVIPELKDKKVLKEDGSLEDRKGEITLRSLLSHTAGFGYSFFNVKLKELAEPTGWDEFSGDAEDLLETPLVNQPGSRWEYGTNIDFAGVAVERVSGLRLDDYFQKNIIQPLGIKDLTFRPTKEMRQNLVKMAQRTPEGYTVHRDGHPMRRAIYHADSRSDRIFQAGGAGCFTRVAEYCKIISALLNDGQSPTTNNRILKKETVDEMFKNQIPQFPDFARQGIPAARPEMTNPLPEMFPQPGNPAQGWGLTFFITQEPMAHGRGKNTVWWAGIANCFWWCDREKGVGGMIGAQVLPFGDPNILGAWLTCEKAVYDGLKG